MVFIISLYCIALEKRRVKYNTVIIYTISATFTISSYTHAPFKELTGYYLVVVLI